MKAVVVGGGIGGLATAIALRRAGHEVEVIERAAALEELGAGLSMAPNALAALDRLGVGDERRRRGGIARRILIRNRCGNVLSEIDAHGRARQGRLWIRGHRRSGTGRRPRYGRR